MTVVTAMNKADILNVIKDAEEKAENIRRSALQQKEKNLAKAKQDSHAKLEEGRTRSKVLYDNMLKKASAQIAQERGIIQAKANKQIDALRSNAGTNTDQASNFLVREFERKTNGA